MDEFDTIEDVAKQIISSLDDTSDKKKIGLLYAFNGTGKTRLSTIVGYDLEKTLSYNAFFEDLFVWDNEHYILKFNSATSIVSLIKDQGLENKIVDNFQKFTDSKIYPDYDLENGEITFNFSPGDERSEDNIKISRGEESLFVWSVFYTILEAAIDALNVKEVDNRETDHFNDLEYIIIDDPVSSIDDTRIITIATDLIKAIDCLENTNIKFLITTHHALFYNIFYNEFNDRKKGCKPFRWLLLKNSTTFKLKPQKDSPFGYHLTIKEKIQEAINTNSLEKFHFNLFRSLLEKSANFLGYANWYDCMEGDSKKEITKLINLYSHGKLSELESKIFPEEHKDLLIRVFDDFIKRFKWN